LQVSDHEAPTDHQRSELVDRIAAGTPVRKLLLVEALGDMRVPLAGCRPDHSSRLDLATVNTHRAAVPAADLECRFDDRIRC
jgi:hypothetical protein